MNRARCCHFLGICLLLLSPACRRNDDVLRGVRYLDELRDYRAVGTMSRPVLQRELPWLSPWFDNQPGLRIRGCYGVPTDVLRERTEDTQWVNWADEEKTKKTPEELKGGFNFILAPSERIDRHKPTMAERHVSPGTITFTIVAEHEDGRIEPLLMDDLPVGSGSRGGWREYEVQLPEGVSGAWRLLMDWERMGTTTENGAFTVPCLVGAPRKRGLQGVILLSVDTLRADHLGGYGYPRGLSPGLDRLSRRAVMFTAARSTSSWTIPAHVSMLTGREPLDHLTRSANSPPLDASMTTLADTLAQNGWRTAACTGGAYMSPNWGLEKGFESFEFAGGGAAPVFEKAKTWLSGNVDTPFFLFLHHFEVHSPYNANNPHPVFAPPDLRVDSLSVDHCPVPVADLVDMYDDGIRYHDILLSDFLDYLCQTGLMERTAFILTADHGEEFLDHGRYFHGHTLYEEQLHIPLLITHPGLDGGRLDQAPRNLIDLFPTVCRLAGIATPDDTPGLDLLAGAPADRLQLPETMQGGQSLAVLREGSKIIFAHDGVRMFDLASDPGERRGGVGVGGTQWIMALRELTKGDAGRGQVWFLAPSGVCSGIIRSAAAETYPRAILAHSILEESADGIQFTLTPVDGAPFCGLSFAAEEAVISGLTVGDAPVPTSAVRGGYELAPVRTIGDVIHLPGLQSSPAGDDWVVTLLNAAATGTQVFMLHPEEAERRMGMQRIDPYAEEQLRTLGYL
ncbi:sulfatase [bacterium]|nr:sulfatase [candidate division CSSED10-310 bacterium]